MIKRTNTDYLVPKDEFARIEKIFAANFDFDIETLSVSDKKLRAPANPKSLCELCRLVRSLPEGRNRCFQDHFRSLSMAFETGQPYISICHAGIFSVCVPVMDGHKRLGGYFIGKCAAEAVDKIAVDDILKRLGALGFDEKEIIKAAINVPVVNSRVIHKASEFLYILIYENTNLDPRLVRWQRLKSRQQAQISDFIQKSKADKDAIKYPYHIERQLMANVRIGNRTGAREILNSILGSIILQNPGDLGILKARAVELLSILSRSAAETGVDITGLLEKNLDYIQKALSVNSQPDLCAWISAALNEFIESVYQQQNKSALSRIQPAIDLMESEYDQPITLDEIAKAAYMSVSRFAHLFKEQTGQSPIDYLIGIRINHAKRLLITTDSSCAQICYSVGFNNQSYFTRTFKRLSGMTPRQFRQESHLPGQDL